MIAPTSAPLKHGRKFKKMEENLYISFRRDEGMAREHLELGSRFKIVEEVIIFSYHNMKHTTPHLGEVYGVIAG